MSEAAPCCRVVARWMTVALALHPQCGGPGWGIASMARAAARWARFS
jgi:hypothetical protein